MQKFESRADVRPIPTPAPPVKPKQVESALALIASRIDYYETIHTSQCAVWSTTSQSRGHNGLQDCTCGLTKAFRLVEALLLQRAQEIETLQAETERWRTMRELIEDARDVISRDAEREAQLTAQAQEIAQVQAVCTCRHDSGMSTDCVVHFPTRETSAQEIERLTRVIQEYAVRLAAHDERRLAERARALEQFRAEYFGIIAEAARVSRAPQPEQD